MKLSHLFWAGMILLALCACSRETSFDEPGGEVSTIQVIGPVDIVFEEPTTRGTEIINGSTLRFSWAMGDSLGIFPDKGNQVEFPITSTEGGTSAVFDGGGWGLKNGSSYAAYYPFSVWNYLRNNKTILLDYSGQVQDGNGSFAHLSAYDYLASSRETPANGQVTFEMSRLGAILYIDIVVPKPSKLDSLVISCDEGVFTKNAALNISSDEAIATSTKKSKTLTLHFKNTVTTEANETVRGYLAVYPVDFSDKTVYAYLYTETGLFGATVQSRAVDKGKAAFLRFSEEFTPILDAIDMGLSVKWASFNLGASKPEEFGNYYAWGETEPHYSILEPLTWKEGMESGYMWETYKWCNGSNTWMTKYCFDPGSGLIDLKTVLDLEDDAAHVSGNWRMPTDTEWTELRENCSMQFTSINDVSGYMFTSNKTGNSIFFPIASYCYSNRIQMPVAFGYYWSSSLDTDDSSHAWSVIMYNIQKPKRQSMERFYGLSIRPVLQ